MTGPRDADRPIPEEVAVAIVDPLLRYQAAVIRTAGEGDNRTEIPGEADPAIADMGILYRDTQIAIARAAAKTPPQSVRNIVTLEEGLHEVLTILGQEGILNHAQTDASTWTNGQISSFPLLHNDDAARAKTGRFAGREISPKTFPAIGYVGALYYCAKLDKTAGRPMRVPAGSYRTVLELFDQGDVMAGVITATRRREDYSDLRQPAPWRQTRPTRTIPSSRQRQIK